MSSETGSNTQGNSQGNPLVRKILPIAVVALAAVTAITLLVVNRDSIPFLQPSPEEALPLTLGQPFSFSGRIVNLQSDEKSFTFEADIEDLENPGRYVTKVFTVWFDDASQTQKVNIARLHLADASTYMAPEELAVGQSVTVATQDNPQAVERLYAQSISYYYRP